MSDDQADVIGGFQNTMPQGGGVPVVLTNGDTRHVAANQWYDSPDGNHVVFALGGVVTDAIGKHRIASIAGKPL